MSKRRKVVGVDITWHLRELYEQAGVKFPGGRWIIPAKLWQRWRNTYLKQEAQDGEVASSEEN